jgi:hypothetical protein
MKTKISDEELRVFTRKSTSATLKEIVKSEAALRKAGIDAKNEDDWQELSEIIARIERKLAALTQSP